MTDAAEEIELGIGELEFFPKDTKVTKYWKKNRWAREDCGTVDAMELVGECKIVVEGCFDIEKLTAGCVYELTFEVIWTNPPSECGLRISVDLPGEKTKWTTPHFGSGLGQSLPPEQYLPSNFWRELTGPSFTASGNGQGKIRLYTVDLVSGLVLRLAKLRPVKCLETINFCPWDFSYIWNGKRDCGGWKPVQLYCNDEQAEAFELVEGAGFEIRGDIPVWKLIKDAEYEVVFEIMRRDGCGDEGWDSPLELYRCHSYQGNDLTHQAKVDCIPTNRWVDLVAGNFQAVVYPGSSIRYSLKSTQTLTVMKGFIFRGVCIRKATCKSSCVPSKPCRQKSCCFDYETIKRTTWKEATSIETNVWSTSVQDYQISCKELTLKPAPAPKSGVWKRIVLDVSGKKKIEVKALQLMEDCSVDVEAYVENKKLTAGCMYEAVLEVTTKRKECTYTDSRYIASTRLTEIRSYTFEASKDKQTRCKWKAVQLAKGCVIKCVKIRKVAKTKKLCLNSMDLCYKWEDKSSGKWCLVNQTSEEGREIQVTSLEEGCAFTVYADIAVCKLVQETVYEAVFQITRTEIKKGEWESAVELCLELPDGTRKTRHVSLAKLETTQTQEVIVGCFKVTEYKEKTVRVSMRNCDNTKLKEGLVIKCLLLRPSPCKPKCVVTKPCRVNRCHFICVTTITKEVLICKEDGCITTCGDETCSDDECKNSDSDDDCKKTDSEDDCKNSDSDDDCKKSDSEDECKKSDSEDECKKKSDSEDDCKKSDSEDDCKKSDSEDECKKSDSEDDCKKKSDSEDDCKKKSDSEDECKKSDSEDDCKKKSDSEDECKKRFSDNECEKSDSEDDCKKKSDSEDECEKSDSEDDCKKKSDSEDECEKSDSEDDCKKKSDSDDECKKSDSDDECEKSDSEDECKKSGSDDDCKKSCSDNDRCKETCDSISVTRTRKSKKSKKKKVVCTTEENATESETISVVKKKGSKKTGGKKTKEITGSKKTGGRRIKEGTGSNKEKGTDGKKRGSDDDDCKDSNSGYDCKRSDSEDDCEKSDSNDGDCKRSGSDDDDCKETGDSISGTRTRKSKKSTKRTAISTTEEKAIESDTISAVKKSGSKKTSGKKIKEITASEKTGGKKTKEITAAGKTGGKKIKEGTGSNKEEGTGGKKSGSNDDDCKASYSEDDCKRSGSDDDCKKNGSDDDDDRKETGDLISATRTRKSEKSTKGTAISTSEENAIESDTISVVKKTGAKKVKEITASEKTSGKKIKEGTGSNKEKGSGDKKSGSKDDDCKDSDSDDDCKRSDSDDDCKKNGSDDDDCKKSCSDNDECKETGDSISATRTRKSEKSTKITAASTTEENAIESDTISVVKNSGSKATGGQKIKEITDIKTGNKSAQEFVVDQKEVIIKSGKWKTEKVNMSSQEEKTISIRRLKEDCSVDMEVNVEKKKLTEGCIYEAVLEVLTQNQGYSYVASRYITSNKWTEISTYTFEASSEKNTCCKWKGVSLIKGTMFKGVKIRKVEKATSKKLRLSSLDLLYQWEGNSAGLWNVVSQTSEEGREIQVTTLKKGCGFIVSADIVVCKLVKRTVYEAVFQVTRTKTKKGQWESAVELCLELPNGTRKTRHVSLAKLETTQTQEVIVGCFKVTEYEETIRVSMRNCDNTKLKEGLVIKCLLFRPSPCKPTCVVKKPCRVSGCHFISVTKETSSVLPCNKDGKLSDKLGNQSRPNILGRTASGRYILGCSGVKAGDESEEHSGRNVIGRTPSGRDILGCSGTITGNQSRHNIIGRTASGRYILGCNDESTEDGSEDQSGGNVIGRTSSGRDILGCSGVMAGSKSGNQSSRGNVIGRTASGRELLGCSGVLTGYESEDQSGRNVIGRTASGREILGCFGVKRGDEDGGMKEASDDDDDVEDGNKPNDKGTVGEYMNERDTDEKGILGEYIPQVDEDSDEEHLAVS